MCPNRISDIDLRDDTYLSEAFWANYFGDISDPKACWLFMGPRHRQGYGRLTVYGVTERAHRVAWQLTHGPIPNRLMVLHDCDTPPCCNPSHLHLGTQAQNVQEMWDRNQTRKRAKPRPGHKCRGEAHHSAKLTAADVLDIRAAASEGTDLQPLATRYGVTKQSIWAIVHRKKWKHV